MCIRMLRKLKLQEAKTNKNFHWYRCARTWHAVQLGLAAASRCCVSQVVMFGATGDLSKKYGMGAFLRLFSQTKEKIQWQIVGVSLQAQVWWKMASLGIAGSTRTPGERSCHSRAYLIQPTVQPFDHKRSCFGCTLPQNKEPVLRFVLVRQCAGWHSSYLCNV